MKKSDFGLYATLSILLLAVFSIIFVAIFGLIMQGYNTRLFINKFYPDYQKNDWIYKGSAKGFQELSIQKKLLKCMDLQEFSQTHIPFFYRLTKEEGQQIYDDYELNCSSELIENISLNSNTGSSDLISFLINHDVLVLNDYKKYTK
jgi:hypothetical protein